MEEDNNNIDGPSGSKRPKNDHQEKGSSESKNKDSNDMRHETDIQTLGQKSKNALKKKKYNCQHCEYSTDKISNLTRHEQNKHNQDGENNMKKYKCNKCDYSSNQNNDLTKHEENMHKIGQKGKKAQKKKDFI